MKLRVSIATDFEQVYKFPRTYEVKGGTPSDVMSEVHYFVPTAIYADWFSLKIEFLDDDMSINLRPAILRRIGLELAPKLPTEEFPTRTNKADQQKSST